MFPSADSAQGGTGGGNAGGSGQRGLAVGGAISVAARAEGVSIPQDYKYYGGAGGAGGGAGGGAASSLGDGGGGGGAGYTDATRCSNISKVNGGNAQANGYVVISFIANQ